MTLTKEQIDAGIDVYRKWKDSDEWDERQLVANILRLGFEAGLEAAAQEIDDASTSLLDDVGAAAIVRNLKAQA